MIPLLCLVFEDILYKISMKTMWLVSLLFYLVALLLTVKGTNTGNTPAEEVIQQLTEGLVYIFILEHVL